MIRFVFGLVSAALVLQGCAKFPANGSSDGFTHLIFRFSMKEPINPVYVYVVAIRPILAGDKPLDGHWPVPVITTGSKNGFVEGWPTRFIRYEGDNRYTVYKFPPREVTPEDDNPRELGAEDDPQSVLPSNIVDPRLSSDSGTVYGRELGFEIDTRYLVDSPDDPQKILSIQFNILTMNKTARISSGDRVMDALGDTTLVLPRLTIRSLSL